MNKTTVLLAAATLAAPAFAQGTDECMGATVLTAGTSMAFDTSTATLSAQAWPCALNGGPDLWFEYTSTVAGGGSISIETCGSSYDTALELFSGTCGALVPEICNDDACGLQSTVTTLAPAAGTVYYVRVGGYNGAVGAGTILVTETTNPCTGPDDMFEDNDTCQTATSMVAGSYTGLVNVLGDEDFYTVTLQPSEVLTVTLLDTLNEDLDLNQFDSGCNLLTFWNTDGFTYSNVTGAPEVVTFEVFLDPGFSGIGCLNYDMDIDIVVGPDCSMPDMFEDSDDCLSAAPIGDGSYMGLNVEELDNDYYAVTVPDGNTLDVSIFFSNAFGDTDVYLWDPLVDCDTNVAGTGGAYLVRGFSATDDETISYTNSTGAAQNLIIEVDMFTAGACNEYDMDISGPGMAPNGIGTPYCMANLNSTGVASEIIANGSRVVANNDVTLSVDDLPVNSFGFFIVSPDQGFVPNPGGSSGNLCLAGAIGRYVGPGQVQNSGGAGMISLAIDLNAIPSPTGFIVAAPGDTWNFQLWHRDSDMGTPTSNFSNGTSVDFL